MSTTITCQATVYFNETRGSRFEAYVPTAEMVASRYFVKRSLVFEIPTAQPGDPARNRIDIDTMLAEAVYMLGNRDDRPNGAYERSISVADVIVIHGASSRPSSVFAVGRVGMCLLTSEEWPPRSPKP